MTCQLYFMFFVYFSKSSKLSIALENRASGAKDIMKWVSLYRYLFVKALLLYLDAKLLLLRLKLICNC